jgi:hypothetical protein
MKIAYYGRHVHHVIDVSLALLCMHPASCHSNGEGLKLIGWNLNCMRLAHKWENGGEMVPHSFQ